MKIIFDSERQMMEFFCALGQDNCPGDFINIDEIRGGLRARYCCVEEPCWECWKNCGIEVEVRE